MPINPWISNNFLDSCAFDPKYSLEDKAAIEIFRLNKEEELLIIIAHSTQKEIEHPNTPNWVKCEAANLLYTLKISLPPDERTLLLRIEEAIAGEGKVANIDQDARHIFEAQKYGSYFITTDKRLLRKGPLIRSICRVYILKPTEFLNLVRSYKQSDKEDLGI
jgi:hypothetical protein